MQNKPRAPRSVSETGQFPIPDGRFYSTPQEPPEAKDAHWADPASITGVIPLPIITEGEDHAKQRDDDARGKRPNR